jgi:hypothetical protein
MHTTTPRHPRFRPLTLALLAAGLVLTPAVATAADPTAGATAPVFGGYLHGFFDFWMGQLRKQNGVIMFVLGVGAVSLFIITRGKWRK